MTQGFYSDGESYKFLCIRNDGTVARSMPYCVSYKGHLKSVFNFLLSMLIIAAESSPNTSPAKPGPEQDKRIENFDQEVFVEVFEDIGMATSIPPADYDEVEEELNDWSDIIIEE
jgi:hypothetical protein